jgi:hypothetical protein
VIKKMSSVITKRLYYATQAATLLYSKCKFVMYPTASPLINQKIIKIGLSSGKKNIKY